ncbi:MAG: hypothetical protein L3J45_05600 [Flavobacteriaceae bacterium]|nr:hypothetical protein [Flavobacteriaceae bacterium]
MKKIIFATLLLSNLIGFTQETSKTSLDFGADFQSRYIWRGIQFGGNSASAQPYLEVSSGKFTFAAWAAYSLGGINQFQETDLYVTYAPSDNLSFTITDYFFPEEGTQSSYFTYKNGTGHVYEFTLAYASEDSPIGFTLATNFAGADKNGTKQSYSTYLELNYSKTVNEVDYSLFAGGVVGDKGGYYLTSGSGLINLGLSASKNIKLSSTYSLPINTALIFNPDQGNIFITFGFSL